jgi:ABC-type antimicrobial peptide transport system permease subunit
VLEPGALLLALLAIASVTVVVGRRLSEYARRGGLLKAVGGTPRLVAAMFLAENLVLAVPAAAVGLVAGWLAAPLLTGPGAALVGAPGAPSLTPLPRPRSSQWRLRWPSRRPLFPPSAPRAPAPSTRSTMSRTRPGAAAR